MVQNTRATPRLSSIRPLRAPQQLEVELGNDTLPKAIALRGVVLQVADIQDRWRIDDEWWRSRPVSRVYYQLILEDRRPMTVFEDLETLQWFQQKYD